MNRLTLGAIPAILTLLLTLTTATALAETGSSDCVHGNGKNATMTRELAKFDRLEVSGVFEIRVSAGQSRQFARLTGEENILPLIATELKGNKLAIHPTKPICIKQPIVVEIDASQLIALESSGSAEVKIAGLNTGKFSVNIDGSGDVELAGQAANLEAALSGAGSLDAQKLKTEDTSISISGSGTADVYAAGKLKVDIVGVGEVNYYGNPKKIEKQIMGVGTLNPM